MEKTSSDVASLIDGYMGVELLCTQMESVVQQLHASVGILNSYSCAEQARSQFRFYYVNQVRRVIDC